VTGLARHRIVTLDPAHWARVVAAQRELPPVVVEWVASGRPLIARRPTCGDGAGGVPLGLPLPPSLGKQRLAFVVPPDAIVADAPPPLLADAATAVPEDWQATIRALVALDPGTRCFGSLAWAWLTGLPYLSATSDLDCLWTVADANAADRRVAAIAGIEADAPIGLDGELLAPTGHAVQWREWASGARELLVKAADGNRVVAREAVLA